MPLSETERDALKKKINEALDKKCMYIQYKNNNSNLFANENSESSY